MITNIHPTPNMLNIYNQTSNPATNYPKTTSRPRNEKIIITGSPDFIQQERNSYGDNSMQTNDLRNPQYFSTNNFKMVCPSCERNSRDNQILIANAPNSWTDFNPEIHRYQFLDSNDSDFEEPNTEDPNAEDDFNRHKMSSSSKQTYKYENSNDKKSPKKLSRSKS
jgi:hypothetical protein